MHLELSPFGTPEDLPGTLPARDTPLLYSIYLCKPGNDSRHGMFRDFRTEKTGNTEGDLDPVPVHLRPEAIVKPVESVLGCAVDRTERTSDLPH